MAVVVLAFIVFAALALGAIVVDAGSLYSTKRQLQTSADAAALAAVRELPNGTQARIETVSDTYARGNAKVRVDSVEPAVDSTELSVTVTVVGQAPLAFAQSWGQQLAPIRARATARMGSPTAYGRGVMPFGIMAKGTKAYPYGLNASGEVILHTDTQDATQGNFHMVDLVTDYYDGQGNSTQFLIRNGGTTKELEIGDILNSQTGNASNPDFSSLNTYFRCGGPGEEAGHTHADLIYDPISGLYSAPLDSDGQPCRRLITLPVLAVNEGADPYNWALLNGSSVPLVVVGFAQYFVDYAPEQPKDGKDLKGWFVQVIDPDGLSGGQYIPWAGVMYWLER